MGYSFSDYNCQMNEYCGTGNKDYIGRIFLIQTSGSSSISSGGHMLTFVDVGGFSSYLNGFPNVFNGYLFHVGADEISRKTKLIMEYVENEKTDNTEIKCINKGSFLLDFLKKNCTQKNLTFFKSSSTKFLTLEKL